MYDREQDLDLTEAKLEQSRQEWQIAQPGLQLQPWCDFNRPERARSRFGGYERQIEAQVLDALGHLPG